MTGFDAFPPAPADAGRIVRIVARAPEGIRRTLERAALVPGGGIPGDAWERLPHRDPEAAITAMEVGVVERLGPDLPLGTSGDNLYLDLDLSAANLPPGTLLEAGTARLRVTRKPHRGCRKFEARFGPEAFRMVSDPIFGERNLRGVYFRVEAAGEIAEGDVVRVIGRPSHDPERAR